MSNLRRITPWSPSSHVVADEFLRDADYTNWRPKGTGDWLLIYTVSGSGGFVRGKQLCESLAGDAFLYAPHEAHDYATNSGTWRLLWAHFQPEASWLPYLRWPMNTEGFRAIHLPKGEIRDGFCSAIRRSIRFCRREGKDSHDFSANSLEEALLWCRSSFSTGGQPALDPRIQKAIDYLGDRIRDPFDLGKIAKIAGLSVSRFAHLFKEETGLSPRDYNERDRMQRASRLLSFTSLSVSEIATETGFEDPFYFSNRFRCHSGKSPSEFRK